MLELIVILEPMVDLNGFKEHDSCNYKVLGAAKGVCIFCIYGIDLQCFYTQVELLLTVNLRDSTHCLLALQRRLTTRALT